MRPIRIEDAVRAVNGVCMNAAEQCITGVSIDSREDLGGKTFFALKGPHFDGHDFLIQAFDKNCALAVINSVYDIPEELKGRCLIRVADTKKALQDLAKHYLKSLDVLRIAVTGSVGKTTTRNMLHAIGMTKYQTLCNMKNYNNDIGVPLSIFQAEASHELAVLELGMSREGEIRLLADIVRPQLAVITNIGKAHIEDLGGSRDNILKAKWEVTSFFDEKSILILNGDDELLVKQSQKPRSFHVLMAGEGADNDFRVSDIQDTGTGEVGFTITHQEQKVPFRLCMPGRHNGLNAALAAAAAHAADISLEGAAAGLLRAKLESKRLSIQRGKSGATVIDDTYNANDQSMKAALRVLHDRQGGKKTAVLGNMYGMGKQAPEVHREVGRAAAALGIDTLLAIGENAQDICAGASFDGSPTQAAAFTDKKTLMEYLGQTVQASDVILVKGSRAMRMEEITAYLTEE